MEILQEAAFQAPLQIQTRADGAGLKVFRLNNAANVTQASVFDKSVRTSRARTLPVRLVDASPSGEAISPLDGLAEDAIETLDEGGWVFEWDAFEKEGLVEE